VGEIAVGYEMFEEAFEIYRKFGLKTQAIRVLLDHQEDLDRALEYALKVRPPYPNPMLEYALKGSRPAPSRPAPARPAPPRPAPAQRAAALSAEEDARRKGRGARDPPPPLRLLGLCSAGLGRPRCARRAWS